MCLVNRAGTRLLRTRSHACSLANAPSTTREPYALLEHALGGALDALLLLLLLKPHSPFTLYSTTLPLTILTLTVRYETR